ncbi:MAG: DNA2/NAM7 family helicase [Prevotella sp.]|nr:DNA2/NAM7 family helicase [Prevotella sp.]
MGLNESNVTAEELIARVKEISQYEGKDGCVANKMMHETLVLACAEGLKGTRHGFGNLSSQVDTLCKKHHVAPADTVAIHKMRRDSNSSKPLLPEVLRFDCLALAKFIGVVFGDRHANIPLPHESLGESEDKAIASGMRIPAIRCMVDEWDTKTMRVSVDQEGVGDSLIVDYEHTPEYIDLSYLNDILYKGVQLNLLDVEMREGKAIPRMVVVEPDYLLDISSIATCFEDYGHHPLSFVLNQMKPRVNTSATILGNFAGSALDDIINNEDYHISDTIKANFHERALEYCTCEELDIEDFKRNITIQVNNLRQIVDEIFKKYDRTKAILEPSFVCEKLGIQGRVDLMTTDMNLLVEQKSGRNMYIERKNRNRHGSLHVEKHYVQLLLYFGVLAYNFNLSRNKTDIHLLYSKYGLPDGLLEVQPLQKLVHESIKFRNQVVAIEYRIAQEGFDKFIDQMTPHTINVEGLDDYFFRRYQLPSIMEMTEPLHKLTPLERAYFCRMVTFVMKEQLLSKVGAVEGMGNSMADLWNMPLAEKRETGNIYTGLTIIAKEKSRASNGFDTITLAIPDQGDAFLPNFRRSDMVYLYAYRDGEVPDVRKSFLFQGNVADIQTTQLTIYLHDGQQNPLLFRDDVPYAVEHASSDIGGNSALAGLHHFITAMPDRKALLLGQRSPKQDQSRQLTKSYHPNYDEVLLKAKQANDYFLLIGPPGTGKTSMALRFLVEEELASSSSNILLMAYTNRAVDEICAMLCKAGIDFIRLGNEYSCDPQYKPYLLGNAIEECPKLDFIKRKIQETRVIVSTTSTMQSRPLIFRVKHFSLAIVDEASQILEPNIIELLSMHHDTSDIDRFILIGDYKQLPAVVRQDAVDAAVDSPLLREIGLDDCRNSLFERLIKTELRHGRTDYIGILRKQGRMHPDIAEFPNEMFYWHEKLDVVPCEHQLEESIGYLLPSEDALDDRLKSHRMIFIPSKTCKSPDVSDKVNIDEARVVADLLRRVHRFYGAAFDAHSTVGVIVPYRNQIATIRKEIEKLGIPCLLDVAIDTVERYQGSQRDVIIYSFTIQYRYQIAFLTANCFEEEGHEIDRKLNVAITRARKQMIITGNEQVLSYHPTFRKLMDFVKEKEKKC